MNNALNGEGLVEVTHSNSLASPKIAILLCTYNGAEFLAEQLDSIEAQSWENIDVWASDDGSSDNTMDILLKYQRKWTKGRFEILRGPEKGFSQNFQSILFNDAVKADYYAYADQDDVWKKDKLSRAVFQLNQSKSEASLYCSRTHLIDSEGRSLKQFSPLFSRPACFSNALIQNIAGGNTMVMNHQARLLLLRMGIQNVVCHDWWTYILVSGAGGFIYYDNTPSVLYRQHAQNELGANLGWSARFYRLKMLLKGSFKDWNTLHVKALSFNKDVLTAKNKQKFNYFVEARESGLLKRLYLIKKSGVYRQSFFANLVFYFAVVMNKI